MKKINIKMKNVSVLMMLIVTLGLTAHASAQEDVISPDRPGFGDDTKVVGKGRYQLEMGLQNERNSDLGVKVNGLFTPILYRLGINDQWELRLATDGAMRHSVTTLGSKQTDNGIGDSSLGFKWRIMDANEAKGTPDVAILGELDFATGSKAFRGEGTRPSLSAVAEWELSEDTSFGVVTGLYSEKNELGKKFTGTFLGISIGHTLAENWGGFVDIAAEEIKSKANGENVYTIGTGVTYLLTKDAQVDFSVVKGLSDSAPKLQIGVGLSVRF